MIKILNFGLSTLFFSRTPQGGQHDRKVLYKHNQRSRDIYGGGLLIYFTVELTEALPTPVFLAKNAISFLTLDGDIGNWIDAT